MNFISHIRFTIVSILFSIESSEEILAGYLYLLVPWLKDCFIEILISRWLDNWSVTQIVTQRWNVKYVFYRIIIYIEPFGCNSDKILATILLYLISSGWNLYGGFRYIYNRKKILFIVPVDDNRRIQINAFLCADNGKQIEGWIIFFSSSHKA